MHIDKEILAEQNYANPRLVEITNTESHKLYEKVREHQEAVNPFLKRYEEIEAKKAELKAPYEAYAKEVSQELEDMMEKMKIEDQKASKVKAKLVPLIEEEVLPHLGELDEFVGIEKIEDKYYAKINDRIEEWVKAVRSQKPKK